MTQDSASPPTPPTRRTFNAEELSRFVPGLGTLMPEIGTRTWKLYYAAKEGNWAMAEFQAAEIRGLMMTGATTRPAYESDLKSFIAEQVNKVREAALKKDFAEFETAFQAMVAEANSYHDGAGRPYIVWKLPDYPPPDLDFTPR
ncbi:MAG: hypothetical protein GEU75_03705 [Dehalococcoidia bacterium]|nr:hypothetical protein [Dehalococcoidia bacterium]